ncbi:Ig-like domain-containing protein [Candidatus Halobeggiatoa sp. HSG11]|nr:Ig-like domain-containing protein [Candidatus Halobeggiatoa sp. HSG11]
MLFLNMKICKFCYYKQSNWLYLIQWIGLVTILWSNSIAAQICPNTTYGIWNESTQAVYSGCEINSSYTFGLRISGSDVKEFMDPLQYVNPSITLVIDTGSHQSFKVVNKGIGYTGDCTEILPGSGTTSVPAVINHVYCHILEGSLGVTATRATWTGSSFSNAIATFEGAGPSNTAPTINQGSSINIEPISEDSSKSFTLNASDAEGNISSWSISSNPSNGSISGASGSGTSKTMNYNPTANWNGTDNFAIRVTDAGNLSDTINVSVTVNPVNDTPTFTSSQITSINEDSEYNYSIATNDVDGDTLTITAPTKPDWLNFTDNSNGTATLTGTPTNSEVGLYNVTLNVTDSSVSSNQSFTVTVNNVNDAPVLDFNESPVLTAIDEDDLTNGGTSVNAIIDSVSLDMITDVDSNPVEGIAVITVDNTNGSWEFSTNTGSTWTAFGTVTETTARLLTSNVASLIRFVPNANFNGSSNISFRAWDQGSGSNGGIANISSNGGITAFSSNTETASLTINPVNDDPTFTSTEIITVDEDSEYSYSVATTDIDGDSLTITAPTKPDWLTLTDNGDGTATLSNIPTNDEVGQHDIVLQVSDDVVNIEQSFTITVINTNDAPTFVSTEVTTVDEDSQYNYSIITDDVDVGDIVTITAISKPSWLDLTDNGNGTAILTSTPTNDEVGIHSIILQVSDSIVDVDQSFTITVNNTNDAPVLDFNAELSLMTINEDNFTNDGISITNVIDSMSLDIIVDVDGEPIEGLAITSVDNSNGSWEFTTGSSWTAFGSVSESAARLLAADNSNRIRFVPYADFNGNVNISFRAWDQTEGSNGETANVSSNGENTAFSENVESASITISPVNDAPIFTSIPEIAATEKSEYYYKVIVSDVEMETLYSESKADSLTITASTLPAWLTLNDNGNGTATLIGTPTENDSGINTIRLQVSDGSVNVEQDFTIDVTNLYKLTINKIGNGTITSDGINCGGDCEQEYLAGQMTDITLDTSPDTDWIFSGWTGDCDTNGNVSMTGHKTCIATFQQQYSLAINIVGQGKVNDCATNCIQTHINGDTVNLTTTPSSDWKFISWTGDCGADGTVNIDGAKTCTATFQQQHSLTINVTGQGNVTGCGTSCTQTHSAGTTINLTTTADTDWQFTSWSGDCDANGSVIVDGAKTCTAVFKTTVLEDIIIEPGDVIEGENIAGEVANEGVLEDITVEPGAVITGGIIAGEVVNEGTLEAITTEKRTVIEGGNIAGDVVNEGTLSNTTIVEGAVIVGGDIVGTSRNEGTLQDTTIEGSISGGNYSGDTVNEGLISNATVDEGATLIGGKITGVSTNNGTMGDVTITLYAEIAGGDFSGEIENNGTLTDIALLPGATVTGGLLTGDITSEGTIQDVDLAEGVQIIGGTLAGDIDGNPDNPALLGNVTIEPGTTLSYVTLTPTTVLPEGVKLGPGVTLPNYDNPTPEDFGLASEDIENLQADDIASLEPEIFATFDETMLAEIPDEAFAAIGEEQLAQFSEEALAAISPEQFEQMPMEALAGLDVGTIDNLPLEVLNNLTPEHISNLNAEEFQKMPTEDISNLLVNLNLDNIKPEDVAKLIPEDWDFNTETGKVTAPVGAKITPKLLSTPSNMPNIPNMNSGIGLGGSGASLMDSTTESLAKEDLTDFVLSQEESGILNVEGIGDQDGKQYTFIPDAENVIQVDTDKVPIGLSIGAGGFYTITTPDGQQYKVIPAPQDPVALSEAIGGEVEVGKGGDVMMQLSNNVRNARNLQVVMFNPFVEPAPESWCVFDDVTGESMCDFDNAPMDMQPGIHFPRNRSKLKLPEAKVVYEDGSSQSLTPTVYSPETFLEEGAKFPGVEKIAFNMNGTFYVLHEGREYIVAPSFNVQTDSKVSATKIELNDQGGVSYSVPVEASKQTRRARELNMLMFDLFVEPAPESWCVDNDGAMFCDFDNVPEYR